MAMEAAIALNRFGVGARPGERETLGSGGRETLMRQTKDPKAAMISPEGLPTRQSALEAFEAVRESVERRRNAAPAMMDEATTQPALPGLSPEQSKAVVRTYELLADEIVARVNFDLT
ncbi:MAG: hypothetical protein K2Q06_04035, partial [Parvularculaceae bacterium]|nr:hypothetical protein [Parvularculaceae bacterium]